MTNDPFRYDGKRALVVGAASGMGAATAHTVTALGGEVIAVDIAEVNYPVAASHALDLRDRAAVDALADELDGPIHAVFLCAGVADGTDGLMLINVISQRHLFDRLRARGVVGRGAAAAVISSLAGVGWRSELPTLLDFLGAATWDEAVAWLDEHPGNDHYLFSKQVLNAYVAHEAFGLMRDGVRLNAVLPGPTDTPLARANADTWLAFGVDYRAAAGLEVLTPDHMARPLAFLCSDAADGISGVTLGVDQGQFSAAVTGAFPDELVSALLGPV